MWNGPGQEECGPVAGPSCSRPSRRSQGDFRVCPLLTPPPGGAASCGVVALSITDASLSSLGFQTTTPGEPLWLSSQELMKWWLTPRTDLTPPGVSAARAGPLLREALKFSDICLLPRVSKECF